MKCCNRLPGVTSRRPAWPLLAVALAGIGAAPAAESGRRASLEQALLEHAPTLIRSIKKDRDGQQVLYVGVLKFIVSKADKKASDDVGPFNNALASELQNALILKVEKADNVVMLRRPSAGLPPRANQLSARGRKALFDQYFTSAWGDDGKHRADVLLTGVADLRADRRSVGIRVLALDRRHPQKEPALLDRFEIATDPRLLTQLGESYLRPRDLVELPDDPPQKDETPRQEQLVFATGPEPAQQVQVLEQSPVRLEILYNGKRKSIRVGDARLEVDEPQEGTQVQFRLTNKSKQRFGVVMKVNGENTIGRETQVDSLCRKWVLDPGDRYTLKGFQVDTVAGARTQAFVVLPDDESDAQRVRYGKHAGTFAFVLFCEQQKPATSTTETPPPPKDREKEQALVQALGQADGDPPMDLDSLKQSILKTGKIALNTSKGLIVPGAEKKSAIKTVTFRFDPAPVLSATVYYYKPRNLLIPAIGQP